MNLNKENTFNEKAETGTLGESIPAFSGSERSHTSIKPSRKFLCLIPLNPDVHPLQFLAFIISVFVSLSLIVYISGTQSQIITGVLSITTNTGDITGSLTLYGEIVALVAVIVWSMVSDIIERRGVMSISILIMGMVIVCYPHVNSLYPSMLILKLMFSIGSAGSTAMMMAMVMEITHGKGGLVSGCVGLSSGLGAIMAALLFFMVPATLSVRYPGPNHGITYSHSAIGGTAMVVAILLYFSLPKDSYKRPKINHFKAWLNKLYQGIKAAKEPRIALGYTSSFFARADEVIISNFISLWITQYYIDNARCKAGETCLYSLASSSSLTGYAQLVALCSTGFFGPASEYIPKELAVFVAGVVGACGCLPFAFSPDPTTKLALGFVILLSCGQYGMIISGMAMCTGDYINQEHNAAISATYSFIGAVGIIIISKIGGVLFDVWMKGAPFLLLGIGHCLIAVMSILVYIHRLYAAYKKKKSDSLQSSDRC
ncbi:major facilitator superfamily domain-containing protein [Choanephora cucurbitarum]|nr:major facilitator superfamily domain-containing protein [Choanephora cucurbitarum]